MKKTGKTILVFVLIVIVLLLTLPLWVQREYTKPVLEIIQWTAGIVGVVLAVAVMVKLISVTLQQNKRIPEMMEETLTEAAGEEKASLCAGQLAAVLRYGKGFQTCSCFLALTATRLLMVVMNLALVPVQSFGMPLADITECRVRRSFIVPSQMILTLRFGKEKAKYRLYKRYRQPDDQAEQVERLIARLSSLSR